MDYDQAIRLDPGDRSSYYGRGYAWGAKLQYDKAIADLSEAIRLDPQFAAAYSIRSLSWSAKGEHDKAIADFDEAIRLDPQECFRLPQPGQRLEPETASTTRPSPTTTEAIRLDPRMPAPTTTGASPGPARRTTTRPSPTSTEAIRLDPKYASAYFNRGDRLGQQEGVRQGHRRLQRGHPARSPSTLPPYC